MADVFISYARDERERAQIFRDKLDALGLSTFFDIEGGIDAGDAYTKRITEGIRASKIVLGCWSAAALARDWVRRECLMARDQQKLVPICVAPLRPADLPAEFYDLSYEDVADYTGQEKHFGWSQTLAAIARRLEAWAEAHPDDPQAPRTLDAANAVRKASLAARTAPQATGSVAPNPSGAAALWSTIQLSKDARELRRFAESFPGTMESFEARKRAERIEAAAAALQRLRVYADSVAAEARRNAADHKLKDADRERLDNIAFGEVRAAAERVRAENGAFLPAGEPEASIAPALSYLQSNQEKSRRSRSMNAGCHMAILALAGVVAAAAVLNGLFGG